MTATCCCAICNREPVTSVIDVVAVCDGCRRIAQEIADQRLALIVAALTREQEESAA